MAPPMQSWRKATRRQYRGQLREHHLQRGGGGHRQDQQEAQCQYHAEREHALAQPGLDAFQALAAGVEDPVQRVLQLGEHGGGTDEQQQRAPQPGQRSDAGLAGGVVQHGVGDAGHAAAGHRADLADQRLLRGRVQRGGQPQQQHQQRRHRQQGVEGDRGGLGQHVDFDEALGHRHREAVLQAISVVAKPSRGSKVR
ncbi:hypothetical protein G6F57_016255 [Rhizopus arrhizus]|nr:hypothetical protein G6F57_016255 [Rhizopus arrhizus]